MRLAICCLAASAVSIDALWFSSGSNNAGISASNAAGSAARRRTPIANILEDFLGGPLARGFGPPVVMGTEEMMSQKEYGTSAVPIQKDLRWNCDVKTADNICNYNRHYAEYAGCEPRPLRLCAYLVTCPSACTPHVTFDLLGACSCVDALAGQ